jgi:hypothetical protein
MEHVLLAFVRWQDAPSNESSGSFGGGPGSAASLGVPTRLKDWIRGYPAMLPEPATRSRKHDRLQPRRGARTVRVVSVRRNVRMYTPDLVKTAASWATRPPSGVNHTPNVFAQSRDWERVAPPTLKLTPRYADSFRKRMDLPPNLHPHTGVTSSNASIASSTTVSTLGDSPTDYFGLGKPAIAGEERFRSLTELKWGEFEALGFGGLDPAEKKLQFDLTESARTVRLHLCSVVLLMFTYCVAVASGETNDAHLDGFLVHWIYSHRRATERDPTVQQPPRELDLVLAGATSRYHAQIEKDSEVSPTIRMGHRACDGRRGDH